MTNNEIPPATDQTQDETSAPGPLPQRKRVLIFGDNSSGARDLLQRLGEAMGGDLIWEAVEREADVDGLEIAFFGLARNANAQQPSQPQKTVPLEVVAFPRMRVYDLTSAGPLTTPLQDIERLCTEHKVPLTSATMDDIDALRTRIADMFPATAAEPPVANA